MIQPLTKCNLDEARPYNRPVVIQNWLERLDGITKPTRTEQLEMGVTELEEVIPPEVLIYFARAAWRENDQGTFKRIFLALCSRVEVLTLRAIPDSRFPDAAAARQTALEKFVDLISEDCKGLHDRLDYFEMFFNSGLCRMRVSVVRKYESYSKKRINAISLISKNPETGEEEIPPKLEAEAARFAAQKLSLLDDPAFRSTLFAAIDKLPRDIRDVLLLYLKGMPIEVADPNTMTISRTLTCTGRTVQNRFKCGVLALRDLLEEESQ